MSICVQMLSMQAKLDLAHRDFLALKMDVEDEANSLKQQILVMQKASNTTLTTLFQIKQTDRNN